MAQDKPKSKAVILSAELWRKVEDYRFDGRYRTEAEAIRDLISAGLGARAAKPNASA